tara:strand:+ start:12945 stop:13241 length:297 start_codon:yes stop_codon:yes gene_type:complete
MSIYVRENDLGIEKNAELEDIKERIVHYGKLKDQAEDLFFALEAEFLEKKIPRAKWEELNRYIHTKRDYENSKEILYISESIKAKMEGTYCSQGEGVQ